MDLLHKHGYDMTKACADLIPSSGPVLCRDEMEEWSASEANLFREALDKYGKDFTEIRQDFVSSMDIVSVCGWLIVSLSQDLGTKQFWVIVYT